MMWGNMGFMDLWQQYWPRVCLVQYCCLRCIKLHIALITGPYLYNINILYVIQSKTNNNKKSSHRNEHIPNKIIIVDASQYICCSMFKVGQATFHHSLMLCQSNRKSGSSLGEILSITSSFAHYFKYGGMQMPNQ